MKTRPFRVIIVAQLAKWSHLIPKFRGLNPAIWKVLFALVIWKIHTSTMFCLKTMPIKPFKAVEPFSYALYKPFTFYHTISFLLSLTRSGDLSLINWSAVDHSATAPPCLLFKETLSQPEEIFLQKFSVDFRQIFPKMFRFRPKLSRSGKIFRIPGLFPVLWRSKRWSGNPIDRNTVRKLVPKSSSCKIATISRVFIPTSGYGTSCLLATLSRFLGVLLAETFS